jgi:CheY-like chemotaxis protein
LKKTGWIKKRFIMRILNVEDEVFKHRKIENVIEGCGRHEVAWAKNYEQAIEMLEEPYDLVITDMNYPMARGEKDAPDAGEKLLEALAGKVPVIVCSSVNYKYPVAYGCVWYSDINDWEAELRKFLVNMTE